MTPGETLEALVALAARGLSVGVDENGLVVRGPVADLGTDLRSALREHRELLRLIFDRTGRASPLVRFVADGGELNGIAAALEGQEAIGLDIETTGLDPILDRPRLVQLATAEGTVYVIDLFATGGLGPIADVLSRTKLVGHNVQFDITFLMHHFGLRPGRVVCTLLEEKVLDAGLHFGGNARTEEPEWIDDSDETPDGEAGGYFALQAVVRRHLGVRLPKEQQRSDWHAPALTAAQIAYAVRDAAVLLPLREVLGRKLVAERLAATASLENDLVPVIADIWLAGVGVDLDQFERHVEARSAEAAVLRARVESTLGISNMDSHKESLPALRRRGLDVERTSAEVLSRYARSDETVADLLAARRVASFVRGAGKRIPTAARCYPDGRLRAAIRQLAAPTGRMSASRPNLMGLSKEEDVRGCFVPRPGHVFVDADYAAIELRVLAQVANDEALLKIFRERGDPHRALAAKMTGKDVDAVSPRERSVAKPINFGLAFGMGAPTLVTYAMKGYRVAMTLVDAERAKAVYRRTFPGVAQWHAATGRRRPSVVHTLGGRRRRFIKPRESYCAALNTPVQGTAADGMKSALVRMHGQLEQFGARVVMVIHDEVVVEVPECHAKTVRDIVVTAMIDGMREFVRDVPIVVDASIRTTWSAGSVVADSKEGAP